MLNYINCFHCTHWVVCSTHGVDPHKWDECHFYTPKPITNFDRVKQMNAEQLARFMDYVTYSPCNCCFNHLSSNQEYDCKYDCIKGMYNWLLDECTDDEDLTF